MVTWSCPAPNWRGTLRLAAAVRDASGEGRRAHRPARAAADRDRRRRVRRPPRHERPVLDPADALHPKRIDLSLGRIERLLAALGNPQEQAAAGRSMSPAPTARARRSRPCARCSGRGLPRACLHLAASGALQRAHPRRREQIDEDACSRLLDDASAPMPPRRSRSSRSPPPRRSRIRAHAGRHRAARGRARRPARRDQRDRAGRRSRRSRRSRSIIRRSSANAGGDRRREGRHPEARRSRR